MAIQDVWTIDTVLRRIYYSGAFTDGRPDEIYSTVAWYSWLEDEFDEPSMFSHPVPVSAQTTGQFTIGRIEGGQPWFIDDESIKALYGGSIETQGWTKSGSEGITALRWASATSAPESGDIGKAVAGVTSLAGGTILAVDTVRDIVWVRNTTAAQFQNGEVVDDDSTGTDPDFTLEAEAGFQTGESIWANLFSVGSLQPQTEIYVGQEPDYLGGTAYHDADADSKFERRIEKIDEWWDSDVDFTASPNLLGGAGHFDVLIKIQEAGQLIDGGRLAAFARQFSKIYSHFELVANVTGNYVVPFSSTGFDINSQEGPYTVAFDGRTGNDLEIGDVLENNAGPGNNDITGRLRAVVTDVTDGDLAAGTFDFYLIGENEPLASTDRTLVQLADNDDLGVRGDDTDFDVNGAVTLQGPSTAQGITLTFGHVAVDTDEDGTDENYALQIDCNSVPLADCYRRVMFLAARGNQDGTVADTQDTLLPSGHASLNEAGEFYRGVGDVVFDYDGGQGTQPAQGDLVTNGSGAYGVVVSTTGGVTGTMVLTQVKGIFSDNDTVAEIDAAASNDVTVNEPTTGAARPIVDNTGAPFGTFAGGRWFLQQGVVLINVPTADANNWETVDLDGTRRAPPTSRTITFAGLAVNDRAGLFEVTVAGGTDFNKSQNGVGGAGAAVSDTSIPLDSNVSLDVPKTGWARVVDDSATDGTEYRYEYSDVTLQTVTLRTGANLSGTCEAGGSATVLVDTGLFTNFGSDGNCKVGHEIRNTTSGARAVVLRKIDNDSIETTPLSSGTWADTEGWEANQIVTALVDADTVYFGFIDDTVISGTTLSKNIKFVSVKELVARMRFSDPDVGGQRQLPFQQTNIQLTDADLRVTAIRNADTIATA